MKNIKNSDNAVVGIVAAFLIVGLVVTVLSVIQTQYVPKWMEERESDHMNEVENQFTQLKYALDIQSIVNETTAVSTSISLGNKEMSFFNAGRTFDTLSTVPESCKIQINYTDYLTGDTLSKTYKTDAIKYSSNNYYFVNQNFVYEAGSLILCQDNNNVLIGRPHLVVTKPIDRKNISIVFVNISGVEGKMSSTGFGSYDIYTQVMDSNMTHKKFSNVSTITIETEYTNAWNTSFSRSFRQLELPINYGADTISPNKLVITFYKDVLGDYYYDLYIREVKIKAEIGYGLSNS